MKVIYAQNMHADLNVCRWKWLEDFKISLQCCLAETWYIRSQSLGYRNSKLETVSYQTTIKLKKERNSCE